MAVTTVASLNSLFSVIYEGAMRVARERNLMAGLVDNRSATGWMNRQLKDRPQISAVSVDEQEDYNNPTTFGATAGAVITPGEVIAQATLTDRNVETDPDSAVRDVILELGGAIATKVDSDLCGAFASFTTDKGDGAGNAVTLDNIAAAIALLGKNLARQFGRPRVVLHPYHWHDIWIALGQPGTSNVPAQFAQSAMADYYVSGMLAADWFVTANIAIDGNADAVSGIFVEPALMLDTRRAPRLEDQRDASARATEYNLTMGYGYGIAHQTYGVKFTADATEPA